MDSMTECESVLVGHEERIWCLAWHPSGKSFASCSGDKTIRLWESNTDNSWGCKNILTDGHTRTIRYISWSPDGKSLASASFDSTIGIWSQVDDTTWDCTTNLEGHENEVKCITWSSSGKFLASCSRDKTVWIWEKMGDDDYECASVQMNHTQDVKRVTWHPSEDILASSSYDNDISLYSESTDDWSCYATLKGHESTVWAIAFNETGNYLVSVSDDRTIRVWTFDSDVRSSKWSCICTLKSYHERPIYDVSWSFKCNTIVTASGDNSICLISATKDNKSFGLIGRVAAAHTGDVNCVSWCPSASDIFITGGDDGKIKVWRCK